MRRWEDVFYHATPARYLPAIERLGLIPGSGRTFATRSWSVGKVFLSAGWENAVLWQGFIAEQLHEDVAILSVTLPAQQQRRVHVDRVALEEGNMCAFYVEGRIDPKYLAVEDTGVGTGSF